MGVANVLCLTGDGVQAGDQPGAKPVFDLDSMSLLETIRIMRDEKRFLSGRQDHFAARTSFSVPPINPFAPPYRFPPASGLPRRSPPARSSSRASTVSTSRCWKRLHASGARHGPAREVLHPGRRRSARLGPGGRWIRSNVPGIHIPDAVIERLEGAEKQKRKARSNLCIELIISRSAKDIPGVAGIHVMAYRQEEFVAEIVARIGRAQGPQAVARKPAIDEPIGRRRLEEIAESGGSATPQELPERTTPLPTSTIEFRNA